MPRSCKGHARLPLGSHPYPSYHPRPRRRRLGSPSNLEPEICILLCACDSHHDASKVLRRDAPGDHQGYPPSGANSSANHRRRPRSWRSPCSRPGPRTWRWDRDRDPMPPLLNAGPRISVGPEGLHGAATSCWSRRGACCPPTQAAHRPRPGEHQGSVDQFENGPEITGEWIGR